MQQKYVEQKEMSNEVKRRRVCNICCLCKEKDIAHLLYIGCSNEHMICHVCSRSLIASKTRLKKFPARILTEIEFDGIECPLCRESLHGVSNMFGACEVKQQYICPYVDLKVCESKNIFTANELQKHILKYHNKTIQCPNCNKWLKEHKGDKNMNDLIYRHVNNDCHKILCNNCLCYSSRINATVHLSNNNCQGRSSILKDLLGCIDRIQVDQKQILENFYLFCMNTLLRYINQAATSDLETLLFIIYVFHRVHNDRFRNTRQSISKFLSLTHPKIDGLEFDRFIRLRLDHFLDVNNLDSIQNLPFLYKICFAICNNRDYLYTSLDNQSANYDCQKFKMWYSKIEHMFVCNNLISISDSFQFIRLPESNILI